MSESKCTYKCGNCGERFKVSVNSEKPGKTHKCPVCGIDDRKTVVPAYQYGTWGGPMAPELQKFGFG